MFQSQGFKLIVRNSLSKYNISKYSSIYCNRVNSSSSILSSGIDYLTSYENRKCFSMQSFIDSTIQTQTGIFKTLSESPPVEICQTCLIDFHNATGLPWWGTIICTTVLLRTVVTLPLAVYQQMIIARLELIKMEMPNIVKELKKETAIAIKLYNWDEKMARSAYNRTVKKQWNNLIIRENCHPLKTMVLLIFQIPLWITLSISLRNLTYMLPGRDIKAEIIFNQLSTEGFSWIVNLTQADPFYILPIMFGIINLSIIEMQTLSKVNVPTKTQKYITNFFRGFTVCLIPLVASVPSCLVLYWTTSSAFGLIQNIVLMSPKIKRFCKIPATPSELEEPYKQVLLGFKHRLK